MERGVFQMGKDTRDFTTCTTLFPPRADRFTMCCSHRPSGPTVDLFDSLHYYCLQRERERVIENYLVEGGLSLGVQVDVWQSGLKDSFDSLCQAL